jgi:hypothetical protein
MPSIAGDPGRAAGRRGRALVAVASLVAWAWLAGCSSVSRPPAVSPPVAREGAESAAAGKAGAPDPVVRAILARLGARRAQVAGVSGRAELTLEAPRWDEAAWVQSEVLARDPGRLRLRGGIGPVTAFDLALDADHFTFYLRGERRAWTGAPDALPGLTAFPGRPADIAQALLGRPFGTPDTAVLVSSDDDQATVAWALPGIDSVRARFRRDYLVPTSVTRVSRGQAVASVAYGDFVQEDVGWWPRLVTLSWPTQGARLEFTFRSLRLNPTFREGAFEVPLPEGTARTELRAGGEGSGDGSRR